MLSMLRISFLFLLTLSCWSMQAQSLGEQLELQLADKETLPEIMSTVDDFYSRQTEEIREKGGEGLVKLKHWKRWEWYMEGRLGENGDFVDINDRIHKEILAKEKSRMTGGTRAVEGDWKNIGITDSPNIPSLPGSGGGGLGRIDRIAFHPTNANIFYVATPAGGVWKTTDGGTTWQAKSDYIASIGISGIVVDKHNPNTLYALTGTADNSTFSFVTQFGYRKACVGVIKSTDGGDTWSSTGVIPGSADTTYYGYNIVQNDYFTDNFVICTTIGVFETVDAGASWFKIKDGLHYDLKYKNAASGSVAYTVDDNGVYYSTTMTSSRSWTASTYNINPGANRRKSIALAPNNNNLVYVLAGGATSNGVFAGLYRSSNSGVSFTRQSNSPNIFSGNLDGANNSDQASYDNTIAVHPTNNNMIFTGGINIWGSTNAGVTMTPVTKWFETQSGGSGLPYVHADHHMLAFNPLDNKLYACHDGGISVSANNGTTWTNITKGIDVSQIYHMNSNSTTSYRLLGGLQDNGFKHRKKANGLYQHVSSGDGFDGSFSSDTSTIYGSINQVIRKFNLANTNFVDIAPDNLFYKVVKAHPTNPNIVFCGSTNIWKSTNQGTNWSNEGASGSWSLTFAPSNSARMYAAGSADYNAGGSGRALYTSTNTGDTWTPISTGSGFPALSKWQKITDIAVHQTYDDDVYITFGGFTADTKVYFSSNGGSSWFNQTYNLPNVPINCIATANGKVYVGTDIGIYRRNIGASTWVDISDNLPNTIITEILVDQELGNIKVATFGRGVWQFDFCVDNITLTEKQEGDLDYKCDNVLTSTSLIPGSTDNTIMLQGGNRVDLLPGFKSRENSTLIAKTSGCDNPSMPLQSGESHDDTNTHQQQN